ncbi:60S ribosomal protein L29-like [Echinops telfairi]|uniref:60S ribosomal protein L29-like n=1 Tax=Echinops telfairi TaxID=9371 RepID=A0ABM0ZQ04_ECHTE|nr:60S ribosomal protein L29-like [Echinops telfairi]
MGFTKKHNKKGLQKMQANNAKATAARAEVIKDLVQTMEVKAKIPMGVNRKLSRLAYTAHPNLGKWARARIAKGLRLCGPRPRHKARLRLHPRCRLQQDSQRRLAPAPVPKGEQAPAQAPNGTQAPTK